ncbi:MAG: ABC transporter ATP-binding protein [Armatimonadota bacterium]|nr:ABC transporter ATP-binding protein [Armatimonadota bacterium]
MVQVEGLTKRYGEVTAVEELSFHVEPGEVLALLGPNGAGKSTTLKILAGLVRPTCGRVSVEGYDPWRQPKEAKRCIGYLPQRVDFPASLAGEEILFFYASIRGVPPSAVREVVEIMCLEDFLQRPVGTYSGGMKQRLGLSVAILGDPTVLLLDEPTLSLDVEGRQALRTIVQRWRANGKIVIFSSHVIQDSEEMATSVAILKEGRLVVKDGIDALRERFRPRLRVRVPTDEAICSIPGLASHPAIFEDGHLIVSCPPGERLRVLQAIQEAGVRVLGFSTEEPDIEEVVNEILQGSKGSEKE